MRIFAIFAVAILTATAAFASEAPKQKMGKAEVCCGHSPAKNGPKVPTGIDVPGPGDYKLINGRVVPYDRWKERALEDNPFRSTSE